MDAPFRCSRWPLVGLALFLMLSIVVRPCAAQVQGEQIDRAIENGVGFLKRQQQADGTWPDHLSYTGGTTALVTLALLSAGVPTSDESIQRALTSIRTKPNTKWTYVVALQTMALCAAKTTTDLARIQQNVRWLEERQNENGAWGYGDIETRHSHDNSNSQFALLALHEADRFNNSIRVKQEVWVKALRHWESTQNLDGSWGYVRREDNVGSGSMTCAGITSVYIASSRVSANPQNDQQLQCCQADDPNRAMSRGLDWMGKNFSVDENPGYQAFLLYYLYGLERVGRLTARRFIGAHDWYREGATHLVRNQQVGGDWNGGKGLGEEQQAIIATSFCVLFLAKGRLPVLLAKVRHEPDDDWNHHPADCDHLTRFVESRWKRDLTWQIVDPRVASVDDLLQTPVLFISGRDALQFDDATIRKLREYMIQGGFIFGESCCDGRGYDLAFRDFCKRMFPEPEHQLQPLPPTHPVWRTEQVVPPDSEYPGHLFGINVSCRTSLIYTDRDLSCKWQYADVRRFRAIQEGARINADVKKKVEAAMALGINVVAYATNREVKFKSEWFNQDRDQLAQQNFGRGQLYIARVQHSGGSDAAAGALPNLQMALQRLRKVQVSLEPKETPLGADTVFDYPLLFMHGRTEFSLRDQDRTQLKTYLERGGFLLADSVCGSEQFATSFRAELARTFPNHKLERVPASDPIFTDKFGGYVLDTVRRREPQAVKANEPLRVAERRVEPYLEGIKLGERWVVLFSPYDISCALENHTSVECKGYIHEDAIKIGVNSVLYALSQPGP